MKCIPSLFTADSNTKAVLVVAEKECGTPWLPARIVFAVFIVSIRTVRTVANHILSEVVRAEDALALLYLIVRSQKLTIGIVLRFVFVVVVVVVVVVGGVVA